MTTCPRLFEKADEPWTYRCVLEAGHEGDCDPQLRPPPRAGCKTCGGDMNEACPDCHPNAPWRTAAQTDDRIPAVVLEAPIGDEELASLRDRLADPTPKMWNSSTMREVVSRLDASERVLAERTEEVANLSTEGHLRMGHGNSPVRYHAHGEVLWPVYPNGMCRGCA